MERFELTDTMIRQSFDKTGYDEKYFHIYETEVKRRYCEPSTSTLSCRYVSIFCSALKIHHTSLPSSCGL